MMRHYLLARAAAGVALVLTATFGAACAPEATPAPVDASGTPSFGAGDLAPGTHVLVNKNNQWLPATIAQPLGGDRFVVAYDGFGPQWNEAVGMDRIKASPTAPAAAAGFQAGDKVLISVQGRLALGDVQQQVAAASWRVHYDGFGPEAVESVTADRLQRPFAGASAHAAGEAIQVEANGRVLPAKILAATSASRWLVRFDGYSPQYDLEVGEERLRSATPPPAVAPPVAVTPPATPPAAAAEPPAKPEKDHGKKPKPKPEPTAAPAPAGAGPLQAGDAVLVSQRGAWAQGTISAAGASAGQWKIKYEDGHEDEVSADRVQRLGALGKGGHYAAAQPVMVEWHGVFVPGKVLKEDSKGFYRVRFDGQGPEADEVVPVKRLHPR